MLKSLFALLVLLAAPASLQACWGYVPLEHTVDRADYVVHVKVIAIEEDEDTTFAVCTVKEILLGLIVTNRDGHVCITSAGEGNLMSTAVRYSVDDEITILTESAEVVEGRGMVFPGGGHPNSRELGSPKRLVRELVQARMDNAYALLEKFDRLVPDARNEAETAIIEHENGTREDYTDISPEADLLLDLVATNRGAPAEAKAPRPKLDTAARERLGAIALRAVCDTSAAAANAALPLIGGDGHGAEAMIAPADITVESALKALQKLEDLGDLAAVLPHLARHDKDGRAMTWAAQLILKGGSSGRLSEWLWIEHLSDTRDARELLTKAIAPDQGRDFPYEDADDRTLARLVDVEAEALCVLLWHVEFASLGEPTGDQPDVKMHESRRQKLDDLDNQPAYLAVYAYIRAVSDNKESDALKTMKRRIKSQSRYRGNDDIDLDDVSSLEWHIRQDYRAFPAVLARAFQNQRE